MFQHQPISEETSVGCSVQNKWVQGANNWCSVHETVTIKHVGRRGVWKALANPIVHLKSNMQLTSKLL